LNSEERLLAFLVKGGRKVREKKKNRGKREKKKVLARGEKEPAGNCSYNQGGKGQEF